MIRLPSCCSARSLVRAAAFAALTPVLSTACTTTPPPKEEPAQPQTPPKDAAPAFSTAPTTQQLRLLHTSDNESDLLGAGASAESSSTGDTASAVAQRGGVARAKALIDALSADTGAPAVLLAAGDTMMPAPELKAQVEKKNAVAVANNLLGYRASALGNHEFDLGESFLADFIRQSNFPYLSATVRAKAGPMADITVGADELAQGSPWARDIPGRITPRSRLCINGSLKDEGGDKVCTGVTVGLVGATTERLRVLSRISDAIEVDDTLDKVRVTVQAEVDALRKEGVTIIVLLSHLQDIRKELKLVELGLHGIDVIISGGGDNRVANDNSRLFDGDEPDPVCERETRCYPIVRMAQDAEPVLVVATDGQLKYLGNLKVSFDDRGVLTGFDEATSHPLPVDETSLLALRATPSKDALAFEDAVRTYLAPLMKPFAKTDLFLDGTRESIRNRETNLGNLTADAMFWASKQHAAEHQPKFALRNSGGIRAAIGTVNARTYQREGSLIRPLDVQSSLRFNNPLVVVETTHHNLRQTFESAFRGVGTARGSFPQVSANVRVEYTAHAPEQTHITENGNIVKVGCPGRRVRTLRINLDDGTTLTIVENGATVQPDAKVRFTTLAYLAKGGDSYFPAGTDAVTELATTPATEQSSFVDFILSLDKDGKWNGGAAYTDPTPGNAATFKRIVDVGEVGAKANDNADAACR